MKKDIKISIDSIEKDGVKLNNVVLEGEIDYITRVLKELLDKDIKLTMEDYVDTVLLKMVLDDIDKGKKVRKPRGPYMGVENLRKY